MHRTNKALLVVAACVPCCLPLIIPLAIAIAGGGVLASIAGVTAGLVAVLLAVLVIVAWRRRRRALTGPQPMPLHEEWPASSEPPAA